MLVRRVVDEGLRVEEAAHAAGISVRTAYKWLARFRAEGLSGLVDRSSRPASCPHATQPAKVEDLVKQRHLRATYRQISSSIGVSITTVARWLRRLGLNRLSHLEPQTPIQRYEYDAPGGLLHLDIKKLGRFQRPGHRVTGDRHIVSDGAGWEYVHIAIDDASRVGTGSIHADERGLSACKALLQALRLYRRMGVTFKRVLTDNGACYKSRVFRRLTRRLGIKHLRTRPYTPRTNGKAERFIQTALREWAYGRTYSDSEQRKALLPAWLHYYNHHRQHAALGYKPPITRLAGELNNLLALHS
ncbi:MAG: IS481 family transposase [Mycobacterium sp.]